MTEQEFAHYKLNEELVINFSKQLSTLLNAGIPLYKSIQIIFLQTNSSLLKKILISIKENLAEGKSLAEALAKFPAVFSPFYLSMIRVGERHGELDKALVRIYKYQETTREHKQKVINSLTYPIILILTGITVLIMMIVFVLPKFIDIFRQSEIPLPLPTQIIFNLTQFLQNYSLEILFVFIGLVFSFILINKRPEAKYLLDSYKLKLPIIGDILRPMYIARFSKTLGILLQSGIQLLDSIELSKPALTNKVLEAEIHKIITSVRNGAGIAKPLANSKVFPPMMIQMIAVGEETGALDKLLLDVAAYYEQETDFKIKKRLSLIEPIALLIIAVLVAFIASAIMLPLFRMAGVMRTF